MSTTNKIRHLNHLLAHDLPADTADIMIVTDDGGAVTIDDTAVAREIMAATRRIVAAHLAQMETEQAATERAHA